MVNFTTPVAFSVSGSIQLNMSNSIMSGFDNTLAGSAGGTIQCNLDSSGELGSTSQPFFVDAVNNDYHLQANSSAINQCDTGSIDDYDHNPRPFSAGPTPYDMGAFEYQGQANNDLIFANGFE